MYWAKEDDNNLAEKRQEGKKHPDKTPTKTFNSTSFEINGVNIITPTMEHIKQVENNCDKNHRRLSVIESRINELARVLSRLAAELDEIKQTMYNEF